MSNSIEFIGSHARFRGTKNHLEALGCDLRRFSNRRNSLIVVPVATNVLGRGWLANVFGSFDVQGDWPLGADLSGYQNTLLGSWHPESLVFESA